MVPSPSPCPSFPSRRAKQLIAAKLNLTRGAYTNTIDATIEAADELIGNLDILDASLDPELTAELTSALELFNKGPLHCGGSEL